MASLMLPQGQAEQLRHVLSGQFRRRGRGEMCPVRRVPLYDCWGFVMALSAVFGRRVPNIVPPASAVDRHGLYERALQGGEWKVLAGPEPGAVVALRTSPRHRDFVDHVGVVFDSCRFAHIQRNMQVHADRLDTSPYARLIAGFYVWNG